MLYMQGTYRLCKATIAIDRRGEETHCYQVPEGVLVVINSAHREGRLIEVRYSGRVLLMFEEDLVQRARPVALPPASTRRSFDSSVYPE